MTHECPTTFMLPTHIGMTLPARVRLANERLCRRRTVVELDLAALVLADPTRGYLSGWNAGLRGWHFAERDAMAIWTACGFKRHAERPAVLATAARCLRLCRLWDDEPEGTKVYPGAWRGMRWHWGALVGTALACRPDLARVRRLAGELLELDRRQREAERGLEYACRVLSGEAGERVTCPRIELEPGAARRIA